MVLLIASVLASSSAPTSPPRVAVAPLVQARATVRILAGARLQLGHANGVEGQQLRFTQVSTPQGIRKARLVEFE
ncbi:hypothetical protein ACUXST_001848 [Sphingomonas sp. F9_3S_D5_B_2]